MKLYHFTKAEHLASIEAEGIRPSAFTAETSLPLGVVWLTKSHYPTWCWDPSWNWNTRLKLFIPTSDPLLVKWTAWADQHHPGLNEQLREQTAGMGSPVNLDMTWIYFGHIPSEAIREITEMQYKYVTEHGTQFDSFDSLRGHYDSRKQAAGGVS
jgi:hypothetical protein